MTNKYELIQNTKANIDYKGIPWIEREFAYPEKTIRVATSFSGIGAIEHALIRLGLNTQIIFAGDIDEDCKKSYTANYVISSNGWHTDIHDFDASPYKGKVDLLVGGAPCQAFSMRGKRKGFEDTRGTLFREFARILMECRPKVFIFENVRGLLSHDRGNTWEVIKQTFEFDCGYQIYYQVLNGKDYGIPQSRERLFCIGFQQEQDFKFPVPIPLEKTVYDCLDKVFDAKYVLKNKGVNFITREINHLKSFTQVNGRIALCQKRNQQFNWHGDFIFHPLQKGSNDSELTVYNVSNCETTYYVNNDSWKYAVNKLNDSLFEMVPSKSICYEQGIFRKLTPRECLRLMGFDDTFKIVVPDTAAYKQAGNSIIVNVLMALIKQIDITKFAE